MTNILITYETEEPANIESRRIFKLLENKGQLVSRGVLAKQVSREDLEWCDVLLLVRSTSSLERDIAVLANEMGIFVILSIDDDFLSLGETYGTDGSGFWKSRHKCLKDILKVIDCLLTVNELLANKYINYCKNKRYVVTNTIVEKREFFLTAQDGNYKDKVNLAIYVNDGTQAMFNQILRPALRLLTTKYSGRISLYLMALRPDMSEFESSYDTHYVPHMPYKDFKTFLGTKGFDIGIAPLTDTGFSKYKYFNKYIEYTLAGIPAIYSDCPLYRLVIRDNYNGILTGNSAEEWCRAISHMAEDAKLRRNIIENAQNHLYDNFESSKVISKLIMDIPELVAFKADNLVMYSLGIKMRLIKMRYILFKMKGWLHTAYIMLMKGNFKQFWVRFEVRILKLKS